jgi:type VI secretion system secreted protein Hcp
LALDSGPTPGGPKAISYQLKYNFEDLLVSSYQTGGSDHKVPPVDQISLNFAKIEVVLQRTEGRRHAGWRCESGYDLKQMKEV